MAIKTTAYTVNGGGNKTVRAVRITEKNYAELVDYITRNGGTAVGSEFVTKSGDVLNHKIEIVQRNLGADGKVRKGVRVARPGDFIVREEIGTNEKGKPIYAFSRVKEDVFEAGYTKSL